MISEIELICDYNGTRKMIMLEIREELDTVEQIKQKIFSMSQLPKKLQQYSELFIDCKDISGTHPDSDQLMPFLSIKDLLFQSVMKSQFMMLEEPLVVIIKTNEIVLNQKELQSQQQLQQKQNKQRLIRNYDPEQMDAVIRVNQVRNETLYKGTKPVTCELCQTQNKKEEQKILGLMYGPFKLWQGPYYQQFYVHHLCAVWAGMVFIKDEKFQNLQEALIDSLNKPCGICTKLGASLQCKKEGCRFGFHPRCFLLNFKYYLEQFSVLVCRNQFYCQQHAHLYEQDEDFIKYFKEIENIEFESSICEICKKMDTDICCDRCPSKAGFYHFRCLKIDKKNIDQNKQWFCEGCCIGMQINYRDQFIQLNNEQLKSFQGQ